MTQLLSNYVESHHVTVSKTYMFYIASNLIFFARKEALWTGTALKTSGPLSGSKCGSNLVFRSLADAVTPQVYDSDIERNYYLMKEVIISLAFDLAKGNPPLADYQAWYHVKEVKQCLIDHLNIVIWFHVLQAAFVYVTCDKNFHQDLYKKGGKGRIKEPLLLTKKPSGYGLWWLTCCVSLGILGRRRSQGQNLSHVHGHGRPIQLLKYITVCSVIAKLNLCKLLVI